MFITKQITFLMLSPAFFVAQAAENGQEKEYDIGAIINRTNKIPENQRIESGSKDIGKNIALGVYLGAAQGALLGGKASPFVRDALKEPSLGNIVLAGSVSLGVFFSAGFVAGMVLEAAGVRRIEQNNSAFLSSYLPTLLMSAIIYKNLTGN